jgi:hypothetical protein
VTVTEEVPEGLEEGVEEVEHDGLTDLYHTLYL